MELPRIWPGRPYPLGATYDGTGTNFSVFSEPAERVELCLFDADGTEERIDLPETTAFCWHAYLPDIGPGQRYGYRVHGPWDPANGLRCNPAKLLIDPYAKAVEGEVHWDEAVFAHLHADPMARNDADSGPFMPKSVVINPYFDWENDRPLRVPLEESVIYEVHVKGATARHPDIEPELQGRYGGLAHPAFIQHLHELGVTTVELLPVHQFIHDSHLVEQGLRNYWGYNSIGFLAPHNDYARRQTGEQVAGVPPDGEGPPRRRPRGDPGRRLQPHRRGQPPRSHAVDEGLRQRRLLPAGRRRRVPLLRLHRHRQQPQHAPSAHAAAGDGQPAVLGHGDARRRLPLRPGVHAGARPARRRPPVGVLRSRPAGPGGEPGQADRRAVGRRRGRLPGRQLPGPVGGVEREVPRLRARLLAGPGARPRRVRQPVHRLLRPLPGGRPAPLRQRELRDRPRRVHAVRPRRPTTTSTTRPTARTTTTAPPTTGRGTAAPRDRPTTRPSSRYATSSGATSCSRC